jgi:hypothetical protein
MTKIESGLKTGAKANPDESFRVIVRVEGDLSALQEQLEALGFNVTRRLRLIRGFGATAKGADIVKASDEEWILSIEPDGEVHTMDDKNK